MWIVSMGLFKIFGQCFYKQRGRGNAKEKKKETETTRGVGGTECNHNISASLHPFPFTEYRTPFIVTVHSCLLLSLRL